MSSFCQLDDISLKKEEDDLKKILKGHENLINNRINEFLKRDKLLKNYKKNLFSRNPTLRINTLNLKNDKIQNIFNIKTNNDINREYIENTPKRKIFFRKTDSSQNKSLYLLNTNNSSNQKTSTPYSVLKNRTNLKFAINDSKIRNNSNDSKFTRNKKELFSIGLDSNKSFHQTKNEHRKNKNHSSYQEYLLNSTNKKYSSPKTIKKIKYILTNEVNRLQNCINNLKVNDSFCRNKNKSINECSKSCRKSDRKKNNKNEKNNNNSEKNHKRILTFPKNKSTKDEESKINNFQSSILSNKKIKRKTFSNFYKNMMYKKILNNQNLKILYNIDQKKVNKMIESQSTDNKMRMSLKEYQNNLLKNNLTFITKNNCNLLLNSFKTIYDKNRTKHKKRGIIYNYINNIQKKEVNIINKNNKENENLLNKFKELGISPTKYNFKLDRIDFINVLINK